MKKFLSDYPEVMLDWNQELNPGEDPQTITSGSHKKLIWNCHKCGRQWQATVHNRTNGTGCICDAKERQAAKLRHRLIVRDGSLSQTRPEIAAQWHPTLNGSLTPNDVTEKSMYKAWWLGDDGIPWQSVVSVRCRTKEGTKRPKELVVKGYNDLKTLRPDLAKEWNYNRNHNIDIESVMPGSKQKVWWICEKGHEWQATLISRNGGRGCPICNKERSTSFPEQAIFYYVKKFFHDAENRFYLEDKLEIDVYIPSEKIAIEYDGSYYHKSDRKKIIDEKKNQKLRALDLIFIRIVEESVDDYSGYPFIIGCERVNSVSQVDPAIKKLFSLLNKIKNLNNDPDIDSDRDRLEIFEQYVLSEKKNSIAVKNPELISEWHPIKNGTLKPEFIQAMSNKSLWWKCNKCGYEWKAPAYRRTKGMGCPACSGNVVAIGINDLPTTFPDLIIDWDYDKNLNIDPHNCSAGSNQKIWWKCHKCSFSWQTAIANRTRGTGCPKCSGKVVTDETSFAALYPQLVKQWDTDLNHDLSPTDFLPGSEQKIWWRCEKGHLWKCSIANRTHKNNCPYCGNKKLLAGFNDFATIHPELLEEWDDEKNPMEFLAGSNQKVRWICNNGHHWYARISNRIRGEGCPYCNGKRIAKGETDLETKYPVLALEWNYQRNNDLKPSDVTPGSNKKVWWKCSKCNNEWEAIVWSRVRGRGCPFCAGVKPIVGTNDLVTVRPDLMEEWNTEKNSSIDPTSLMPNSRKTV